MKDLWSPDLYHFDADRFESQIYALLFLRDLANLDCVFTQDLTSKS